MSTKITTATVRIMLSHAYCNFEITSTLENPEGVSVVEIENARRDCQSLALNAVNEYKATLKPTTTDEKRRIGNVMQELEEIKSLKDNVAPGLIENLPLYEGKVKTATKKQSK